MQMGKEWAEFVGADDEMVIYLLCVSVCGRLDGCLLEVPQSC